jgi:Ni2+-binding GTPase involved in maturation of urease and hydrogenase
MWMAELVPRLSPSPSLTLDLARWWRWLVLRGVQFVKLNTKKLCHERKTGTRFNAPAVLLWDISILTNSFGSKRCAIKLREHSTVCVYLSFFKLTGDQQNC